MKNTGNTKNLSEERYFDKAQQFLEKNEHLLSLDNWKGFELDYSESLENKAAVKAQIENEIEKICGNKKANGLYAILTLDGEILYVGKGKPIAKRIYDHYTEVHKTEFPERFKTWYDFFREHANIKVICKVIEVDITENEKISERFRVFIERIIIETHNIIFETYREEINKKKREEKKK